MGSNSSTLFSIGEVSPGVLYCIQFGALHFQKNVDKLERVMRRATKVARGLESMTHKGKLGELGFFSPGKRGLKGDLITVLKSKKGLI